MGSTLVSIIAIGVLIILHEAGHFFVARWSKMKVLRFSIGFGPALAKVKRGDTEFQVGLLPLGGFVQIEGMNPHDDSDPKSPTSYMNRPVHQRIATIFAGAGMNYLVGFLLLTAFYAYFGAESLAPVRVVRVVEESAAARAGLQEGDLIVGTASTAFELADELRGAVQEAGDTGLVLAVERDGKRENLKLVPENDGTGAYRIGIELEGTGRREKKLGLVEGAKTAGKHIGVATVGTLRLVGGLFQGKGCDQVTGPIGIVKGMSRRVESSWGEGLEMVASISIMLGIANLLPIPGLDGSRLLFLILGMIRRKPINQRAEAYVHAVGFVLLIALLIVVSIGDVRR